MTYSLNEVASFLKKSSVLEIFARLPKVLNKLVVYIFIFSPCLILPFVKNLTNNRLSPRMELRTAKKNNNFLFAITEVTIITCQALLIPFWKSTGFCTFINTLKVDTAFQD